MWLLGRSSPTRAFINSTGARRNAGGIWPRWKRTTTRNGSSRGNCRRCWRNSRRRRHKKIRAHLKVLRHRAVILWKLWKGVILKTCPRTAGPEPALACLKGRSLPAGDERRRPRENRLQAGSYPSEKKPRGRVSCQWRGQTPGAWSGNVSGGFLGVWLEKRAKVRPAYATPDRDRRNRLQSLQPGIKDRDRALAAAAGRERDFAERSGAQRKGADVDPAQCILTKIDGGFSQHGFALRNAETGIGGVGQGWILRIANADTVGARDGHAETP